ncbi:MAG: hypothetical protein JJU36_07800 [Phycisphaeraceae bacterium]|nr:hypothetical protein [Phycisphaeraceae bacterium]
MPGVHPQAHKDSSRPANASDKNFASKLRFAIDVATVYPLQLTVSAPGAMKGMPMAKKKAAKKKASKKKAAKKKVAKKKASKKKAAKKKVAKKK